MKKAIVTCVMGGYDVLYEPIFTTPDWDFIAVIDNETKFQEGINPATSKWKCFTDREVLAIEDMFLSPVKKQRKIKTLLGVDYFTEYDTIIWKDGNMVVSCDLDNFLERHHKGSLSFLFHQDRNCTYEEAKAVVELKKDTFERVNKLMEFYHKEGLPKNKGMVQTGIMVKQNLSDKEKNAMRLWWEIIKKYSHRDQLSVVYSMWKNKVKWNEMKDPRGNVGGLLFGEMKLQQHLKEKTYQ